MHIYAIQLDSVWEDKTANFAKVRHLLNESPPLPGSLIVLPEMFATGFSTRLAVTLESIGAETELFLREIATQWQCAVLGGVVTPGPEGKGYNQALAIAPDGTELVRYTKVRPFSYGPEAEVHAPGQETKVFEWQGLQIAPLICYDLRFPELARSALNQGAELFICIAAWPARRIQHWLTLIQARAIENQAYVLGVNRCGQEPETSYSGRTVLADPQGILIADASSSEKVLHTEADAGTVRIWRNEFPAVRDFCGAAS
ncbi:putative amidohydrolase [Prosthecobacter fusiformis]|uniref:Putative amidohydrolase n=1 Tax=Prosthecobacter fusiformis TaxID=48464 RepID=A0A4R7RXV6_9BACT|nr:nitrilase-related carbon-nitrogen hydrolase [Prosthecobacter fusiformis]TDU70744.1 putative amidohydrolase [Prosthecobacter fusiformis]